MLLHLKLFLKLFHKKPITDLAILSLTTFDMDNMVVEVEATCVEVEVDVVRNSKYSYTIIVGIRDRKKKYLSFVTKSRNYDG